MNYELGRASEHLQECPRLLACEFHRPKSSSSQTEAFSSTKTPEGKKLASLWPFFLEFLGTNAAPAAAGNTSRLKAEIRRLNQSGRILRVLAGF
jgi:hypothetical protein